MVNSTFRDMMVASPQLRNEELLIQNSTHVALPMKRTFRYDALSWATGGSAPRRRSRVPRPTDEEEVDQFEAALQHVSRHDRRCYCYETSNEVAFRRFGHAVNFSL